LSRKEAKKITGIGTRACRICGRHGGLIRKYSINICRQCFREVAKQLGFRKYD